jgi:hypothetical protein
VWSRMGEGAPHEQRDKGGVRLAQHGALVAMSGFTCLARAGHEHGAKGEKRG